MTENSTNDRTKSTPTTKPSKASSTEADDAPEAPVEATEPETDPSALFPGYLRKLGGFGAALEAIEVARAEAKLPSLNREDYRFVPQRPGGNPFSFPIQVIYKPDSRKEKDLGTFRIGR